MQFGQLATEGGYLNSECTSAMQKRIRRGLEEDALFWATELDIAGYGAYVWKRLQIIASEDTASPILTCAFRYEHYTRTGWNSEKTFPRKTERHGKNFPSPRNFHLRQGQEIANRRHSNDHDVRE